MMTRLKSRCERHKKACEKCKYNSCPVDCADCDINPSDNVFPCPCLDVDDSPKELSEFSRPCSYSGLCFSCKRTSFKKDGNLLCNTKITRPPQSWMYVEDLGEEE